MNKNSLIRSSFRDPSGFLFLRDGILYRQVNLVYKDHYEHLLKSGLYNALLSEGLLIEHDEYADINDGIAYKIIRPEVIDFISYPYEWCFSQLKDAALTTLKIQGIALKYQMTLKDCSAYNIQFQKGKAILIDTLSFEKYSEGEPWAAYRQFCQHFLAPLALMTYTDVRLGELLKTFIDGIPLDFAVKLLPFRSKVNFHLLTHLHLHMKSQRHYSKKTFQKKGAQFTRLAFDALVDSLESAIASLKWKPEGTEWVDYYQDTNYSSEAFLYKKQVVDSLIEKIQPKSIWDFGANTGIFSQIASTQKIRTLAFDMDCAAVEKMYLDCRKRNDSYLLPLCIDLTNPSPAIGWQNQERMSFIDRGPIDTIIALALIHHFALTHNVPIEFIARLFSKLCNSLIIEFILKTDSQVQKMLSLRKDIFSNYNEKTFEKEFSKYFEIKETIKITDSERVLYYMINRGH